MPEQERPVLPGINIVTSVCVDVDRAHRRLVPTTPRPSLGLLPCSERPPESGDRLGSARVLSQNTFVGIGHGVGAWVLRVRTNIVHVAEGLALFPPYYAIN